jgi:hypothetical protein
MIIGIQFAYSKAIGMSLSVKSSYIDFEIYHHMWNKCPYIDDDVQDLALILCP